MPKDYREAPSARGDSPLNHPLLLGIIIGLLLGIVISLAVALWLNRLSNPFVEKSKASDPLPRISPAQPPPPAQAARGPAPEKGDKPEAGKGTERPRFEFYQILPGEKEGAKAPAKAPAGPATPPAAGAPAAAATAAQKPGTDARPGSSPASPKPHSGDVYWLQAGAFSEEREADNLKAKIALTGLEATVRAVTVPDRGTLYRVRLGPYQSLDDANRIKATLSQNGVGAAIIRAAEDARKP